MIFKKLLQWFKQLLTLRKMGEKIAIEYPISWETMSKEDFRSVCIILSQEHGQKESLFLCLCALAHIRPDNPLKYDPKILKNNVVFIIGDKTYVITPTVIREACDQLRYIYDTVGLPPSPLDRVDRKLFGTSFGEFYSADSHMMAYLSNTSDESHLKEAVKILTRGQTRKLLPWQKQAMIIWWNGIKNYMRTKYPRVFSTDGSISDMTQAEILQELLGAMNGGKPQDNKAILKSDCHAVLFALNNLHNNADKRPVQ